MTTSLQTQQMPPAWFYEQNRRVEKRGYDASERTDSEIEGLFKKITDPSELKRIQRQTERRLAAPLSSSHAARPATD